MALFKPYKTTSAKIDSLPIKEGQLIFTTDTKKIYFDITSSNRIVLYSDVIDKLNGVEDNANNYVLPTASKTTLGGVKTTSDVTDLSNYEASPIINGVVYHKDAPVITEFNSNTAVFHHSGVSSIPIVQGTKVLISKSEPSNMSEGDIWAIVE